MPPALDAKDPALPWMRSLERAHALAHVAVRAISETSEPNAHLAPAARRLETGLSAMYDAFDGRTDRPTAIAVAGGRLWDAAVLVARGGLPKALAALRAACRELTAAQERFPHGVVATRVPLPFRAGDAMPPLHTLERPSLTPALRAPPEPAIEAEKPPLPEIPTATTFEELAEIAVALSKLADERHAALRPARAAPEPKPEPARTPPPPGFAHAPGRALSKDEFIRRWARELIDDIGMLGLQRTPQLGDDWRACQALEGRLITAIDAVAALGPTAIAAVEPYAMDAPAADPMRLFAVTMLGGCLEGRDLLAGAERVLHHFGPGDPAIAAAFTSALKLAPNPHVPGVLRTLLGSGDRTCRALGVEVLAHRRWLTSEEMLALADDDDPRLLALVLPALATARDRNLDRALDRALSHADLELRAAALDAMALAAHPRAAAAALEAAGGELGDEALVRLAIVGTEENARWLLGRLDAAPSPSAAEAVGWAGLLSAAPRLIHLLETTGDDDLKRAAGAALERMLGAGLVEEIEVMAEAIEDPPVLDRDPDAEPERPTLAAETSDTRDEPPAAAKEKLEVASIDPERWRDYWLKHGSRLDPKQRTRRGQGYSPSVSLYELDRLPLPARDRAILHRELAARTGKVAAFDPGDFVAAQTRGLAEWESLVRATREVPGAWGATGR